MAGTMANMQAETTAEGWVSAGAWFNTIARVEGDLTDMPRDLQPKTAPPQVAQIVSENHLAKGTIEYVLRDVMADFQQWAFEGYSMTAGGTTAFMPAGGNTADMGALQTASVGIEQTAATNKHHFMDLIFQAIDRIAAMNGVWTPAIDGCASASCFTLGVQFNSNNPMAEITQLGHANINTAYDLFDEYIVLQGDASIGRDMGTLMSKSGASGIAGIFSKLLGGGAQVAGEMGSAIGTLIGFAVVAFFTAGFLLAFFFPLIPFYRFFFGTLGWFLSLFEAMIAVPVIALAHLTPEGEGVMGEKAKAAYYFVFNLFLKPTLMVFGLITGLLMFDLAVAIMNALYMTAVAGTGGVSEGHYTLARLVYSVIYVVILYLCCNKCFQLIDWLPSHAMSWMGAQSLHHPNMGDPMEIGNYMAVAGGYVENQIVGGAGKLMGGPAGGAILGAMKNNPATAGMVGQGASNFGRTIGAVTGSASLGNTAESIVGGGANAAGAVVGAAGDFGGAAMEGYKNGGGRSRSY